MHVVLGVHGDVEVDDGVDARDVDAAAHHVGGHEHLDLALAELLERLLAGLLRAVGVHDVHLDLRVLEHLAHVVHAMLRAAEDEHALGLLSGGAPGGKKRAQKLGLLGLRDGAEVLVDGVGRLAHAGDLDRDGVGEQRVDGGLDRRRDGRREEQRLVLGRQRVHDAADARPEAHVQHAVGLVEHERLHVGEAHVVVLHEVEEPPRGGDEKVAALLELLDLVLEAGAAHDDDGLLAGFLADDAHDLVDLSGELARRRDDERVRALALRAGDDLQRRQAERGGLARAGLRGGDDVAPGEDLGDGAGLDRRGGGKAEGVYPGQDLLV